MRRLLLCPALIAASLLVASAASAKGSGTLKGEVYENFKIEMKNPAGKKLTTIKAGTYKLKVEDPSSIHNFRLKGPGVNRATSVAGKSETTWTVTLKPGTYTFLCDPHASTMRGTFRVTK